MPGMELLGFRVCDRVTGIEGVATSVCYDLFGCIQVCLQPQGTKKDTQESHDGRWYDLARLDIMGERVMVPPPFTRIDHGPADKPTFNK